MARAEKAAHRELKRKGYHARKEFFQGDLLEIQEIVPGVANQFIIEEEDANYRAQLEARRDLGALNCACQDPRATEITVTYCRNVGASAVAEPCQ